MKTIDYILTCQDRDSSVHKTLKEAIGVGKNCPDLKSHEVYRRTFELVARYCKHKKCWRKLK